MVNSLCVFSGGFTLSLTSISTYPRQEKIAKPTFILKYTSSGTHKILWYCFTIKWSCHLQYTTAIINGERHTLTSGHNWENVQAIVTTVCIRGWNPTKWHPYFSILHVAWRRKQMHMRCIILAVWSSEIDLLRVYVEWLYCYVLESVWNVNTYTAMIAQNLEKLAVQLKIHRTALKHW